MSRSTGQQHLGDPLPRMAVPQRRPAPHGPVVQHVGGRGHNALRVPADDAVPLQGVEHRFDLDEVRTRPRDESI